MEHQRISGVPPLWWKWLAAVGVSISLFGLALALFPQSEIMNLLMNQRIDPIFWGKTPLPSEMLDMQAWIYGVLGATVCGWGILIAFIAWRPFRNGERWSLWAVYVSVAVWFCIDTSLSAYHRVWFNVLFNTVLLAIVIVPVIAAWKCGNVRNPDQFRH